MTNGPPIVCNNYRIQQSVLNIVHHLHEGITVVSIIIDFAATKVMKDNSCIVICFVSLKVHNIPQYNYYELLISLIALIT